MLGHRGRAKPSRTLRPTWHCPPRETPANCLTHLLSSTQAGYQSERVLPRVDLARRIETRLSLCAGPCGDSRESAPPTLRAIAGSVRRSGLTAQARHVRAQKVRCLDFSGALPMPVRERADSHRAMMASDENAAIL